jgi:hypothetical protein
MRVVLLLALVACASPQPKQVAKPPPASPISERMDTFEMNGYVLAGAEYWPYIGKEEIRYPQDVLWGFYPEQGVIVPGESEPNADNATREAIDCAQQSFAALQVFLAKNPPALRRIIELGEAQGFVPRFYLLSMDERLHARGNAVSTGHARSAALVLEAQAARAAEAARLLEVGSERRSARRVQAPEH